MNPTLRSLTVRSLATAGLLFFTGALGAATTQELQQSLTPDAVLEDLMAGNARYVAGELTGRDLQAEVRQTATGQYPKAAILSCLDSRVPVEMVFDQGIGDIFVGREAGNVEDEHMLGSFEFAAKVAGVKLIMVLGHESCGAVKGAIDDVELGNLTELLEAIQKAEDGVKGVDGPKTSKNADYVAAVVESNVRRTIKDIREDSEVLAEMEKAGDIKIVGAVYSLQDGSVTLLD